MPTAADYLEQLKTLLPPGQAFPREAGTALNNLLDGMSLELSRVDARGKSLPVEASPASTNELLPDWESVVGLPDRCSGALEETIQGRKKALIAKLTSTGAQSPGYFIDLAAALGYDLTIEEFRPFRAGVSRAGDALTNGPWVFTWRIHAPETSVISFRSGGGAAAGERLCAWGNDTLECKINHLKPTHTIALFAYGE